MEVNTAFMSLLYSRTIESEGLRLADWVRLSLDIATPRKTGLLPNNVPSVESCYSLATIEINQLLTIISSNCQDKKDLTLYCTIDFQQKSSRTELLASRVEFSDRLCKWQAIIAENRVAILKPLSSLISIIQKISSYNKSIVYELNNRAYKLMYLMHFSCKALSERSLIIFSDDTSFWSILRFVWYLLSSFCTFESDWLSSFAFFRETTLSSASVKQS